MISKYKYNKILKKIESLGGAGGTEGLAQKITKLENELKIANQEITKLKEISAKVTALETHKTTFESKVTTLESQIKEVQTHKTTFEEKVNNLETRVQALESKQA